MIKSPAQPPHHISSTDAALVNPVIFVVPVCEETLQDVKVNIVFVAHESETMDMLWFEPAIE